MMPAVPRLAFRVAAFVAVVASAADARAFCRTTTEHAPVGYDPANAGCWTPGVPLAWGGGQHVSYALGSSASKHISLADATRIARLAFDAWNHASCGGGPPSVQTFAATPVDDSVVAGDCGLNACDPTIHDPNHLIVFRDNGWPHNDPTNTLALTTVTYGVQSGTIYDADMEINSTEQNHVISAQEPPPSGTYDLQGIMTHEAGHFLGLAHATDKRSIMYALYQPGALDLTADDISGVCAISPPQSAGCSCSTVAAGSRPWLAGAASALVAVGWARRRRRRR